MAIRGARAYKKALAFSKDKWDIDTLEPKKSGETMQDCIEYVRMKMYKDTKKGGTSDDESESEEKPSSAITADTTAADTTAADIEAEGEVVIESSEEKNNNNSNKNDSRSEYYNSDDSHSDTSDDDDSQIIDVPNNYLFPSFFVFCCIWPICSC